MVPQQVEVPCDVQVPKQVAYQEECEVPTVVYEDCPQEYWENVPVKSMVKTKVNRSVPKTVRKCYDSNGNEVADPDASAVAAPVVNGSTNLAEEGSSVVNDGEKSNGNDAWQKGGFN